MQNILPSVWWSSENNLPLERVGVFYKTSRKARVGVLVEICKGEGERKMARYKQEMRIDKSEKTDTNEHLCKERRRKHERKNIPLS